MIIHILSEDIEFLSILLHFSMFFPLQSTVENTWKFPQILHDFGQIVENDTDLLHAP